MRTRDMTMPSPPLWRIPRVRYERMVKKGAFDSDDRVGLLDGLLVLSEPQGSLHAAPGSAARATPAGALGPAFAVRGGPPVALAPPSRPGPGRAAVAGR